MFITVGDGTPYEGSLFEMVMYSQWNNIITTEMCIRDTCVVWYISTISRVE